MPVRKKYVLGFKGPLWISTRYLYTSLAYILV